MIFSNFGSRTVIKVCYIYHSMGEIVAVSKEFCGFELKYVVVDSEPWFKGKVVANALGYINTKQLFQ